LGYGPPQHIAWDATSDADALYKAMKGFGTDEKTLINVLATKDPLQVALLRDVYRQRHKKTLEAHVASEVSGSLEDGLLAIIRGPLMQDVHLLHRAMDGPGTKEIILSDVLLGRSNADMHAIKAAYQQAYRRSLEGDLKGDLSMKTERHFLMVVAGNRTEDSVPVNPQQTDADILEIYKATEGKTGTDELVVCDILTHRNDAQIRAIAQGYEARYRRPLETVIIKVSPSFLV
jgi:annexin A7/11